MIESANAPSTVTAFLPGVFRSLRKDLLVILAIAIVAAAAGGIAGKLTNKAASSAQLVLSPMPLIGKAGSRTVQGAQAGDPLAELMATPLDVKSTSLLCMSDEVLQKTFDQLSQSGALSAPIPNLLQLKQALEYQLTVAKETPYDVTYSPLIVLTAEAKAPADAKLIVNTWAQTIVEASKKYQDAIQGPVAKVLEEQTEEIHKQLVEAEMASERFWTENNVIYWEGRLNEIVTLINNFVKTKVTNTAEEVLYNATAEGLEREQAKMQETVSLGLNPSPKLASTFGVDASAKSAPSDKEDRTHSSVLSFDWINPAYWSIEARIAKERGNAAGREEQSKVFDALIQDLEKERTGIQKSYAQAITGKTRVGRDLIRLEEVYKDIATKRDFAHVASSLNHPELQLVSSGTEWPLPRFRRAILFGAMAGILGCLAAACLSVLYRMVLKPALEA